MWKPVGVILTICLFIISFIAMALSSWCFDKNNMQDAYNNSNSDYLPYASALAAVISIDLLMVITSFVGIFIMVKPNTCCTKCYVVFVVLLILTKIIAGAVWYSGVNDTGKNYNTVMQASWDRWSTGDKPDSLLSWHTQRGAEIASIILFVVFGAFSGISALKVTSE